MVTLTIDGVEVTVERGATILEAAKKAGIRIPTLCHDKRLIPYGACRLCVVEVTARGRTRTMPACFNPARDGMEVATHTPKLIDARRLQLMLLLRSHPLLCPSCDAAGNCELQNLVHEYEVGELPFPRESRYFHVDNDSPFIRFNMNLCVKCGMCVRICDEVQGERELSFINRGMVSEVSTDFGRPLACELCGQCASVCPVGAICSKWLVGTGRLFELKQTDTTCSFCSLGCRLTLGEKDGKVVYVSSPPQSPNEGNLCVKGRYGWPYIYAEERLTKPLIRKDGALVETDWNEALSFVADRLKTLKSSRGATKLAALGSARLTNEEAYVFNRFVRTVMETPNLDHAGGYSYRALTEAVWPMLGYPASPNSIREIRNANVIVLFGADLNETHPVAKNEVIQALGRNRAQVIVVDSVQTKLSGSLGTLFLPVPPGTEYIIAYAMLKWIIDHEFFDKKSLDLKAEGFDDLLASLGDYTVERVAQIAGVNPELIAKAAKTYAEAGKATIILTTSMIRMANSVELAQAATNLALVTGRVGKESGGLHVFSEKSNSQGALDMGLAPDLLPGFHRIEDEDARAKFSQAWDFPLPVGRGFDATEILEKSEQGEIAGLYIVGENPVESYPDRDQVERALGKLEFLVVQDMFLTPTAKMAHAVLPVSSFAGKSGTYTSADRRIQRLRPSTKMAKAKSDLEIFIALAALMGKPSMTYSGPERVMEEISSLVDVYGGVAYQRLGDRGITWPCLDSGDEGKELLYEGGFPSGKARLIPAPAIVEPEDEILPLYLIPGILKFHSGSMSQYSSSLTEVSPEPYAEMNPRDLKVLGLSDGDTIKVTDSNGTSAQLKAKWSPRAVDGTIIVPYHFGMLKLNSFFRWNKPVVKVQVEKV